LPPIREKSLLKVDSSVSSRRSSMSDADEVSIFKTETPQFGREISNISYVSKSQSNILQPSSVSAKSKYLFNLKKRSFSELIKYTNYFRKFKRS